MIRERRVYFRSMEEMIRHIVAKREYYDAAHIKVDTEANSAAVASDLLNWQLCYYTVEDRGVDRYLNIYPVRIADLPSTLEGALNNQSAKCVGVVKFTVYGDDSFDVEKVEEKE